MDPTLGLIPWGISSLRVNILPNHRGFGSINDNYIYTWLRYSHKFQFVVLYCLYKNCNVRKDFFALHIRNLDSNTIKDLFSARFNTGQVNYSQNIAAINVATYCNRHSPDSL